MKPVYLVGPTAVGKSAVAMEIAGRVGGEIVSVDSMQVYRGLDIGSAKPSAEELRRVRHHLIDVAGLDDSFDAARFVALAKEAVADMEQRGVRPVFCGGTGLYLTAWLEGLGQSPSSDPALREELEGLPLAQLLEELRAKDPEAYAKIDRENPRRVVRAVEVIRLTGRPFSEQRARWRSGPRETVCCLAREAEDLRRRIESRVDAMFAAGLVEETRRLLEAGLEGNRFAMQAIGYRQVAEHLRGVRGLEETVALIKTRTWQFSRRQMTWFRNQLRAEMISVAEDEAAELTAERVMERFA